MLKRQSLFVFLLLVSVLGTLALRPAQHREVALREIGHLLLLSAGDSTARVMPVQNQGSDYVIEFSSSLSISPDSLVDIVEKVIERTDLPDHYLVSVQTCEAQEVVYSFERAPFEQSEIVPCLGRDLSKSCYRIQISFPDLQGPNLAGSSTTVLWFWIVGILILLLVGWFFTRRKPTAEEALEAGIALGKYRFFPEQLQLSFQGEVQDLSAKESDLLALLLNHANETIERAQILQAVWGDDGDYVGRTLDVFISKLRKKLEADPQLKIVNARGVGYRLVVKEH